MANCKASLPHPPCIMHKAEAVYSLENISILGLLQNQPLLLCFKRLVSKLGFFSTSLEPLTLTFSVLRWKHHLLRWFISPSFFFFCLQFSQWISLCSFSSHLQITDIVWSLSMLVMFLLFLSLRLIFTWLCAVGKVISYSEMRQDKLSHYLSVTKSELA